MSQTYRGRSRGTARNIPPKQHLKFNFGENAKKFFSKLLKQTVFAVSVILILYIVRTAAPGLWANISPPIHSVLERSIDFVSVYNNTIGRIFPNAVIDNENDIDDAAEPLEEHEYDDEYFEAFRVLDEDEILQLYNEVDYTIYLL